jgi:hypothetical protein
MSASEPAFKPFDDFGVDDMDPQEPKRQVAADN